MCCAKESLICTSKRRPKSKGPKDSAMLLPVFSAPGKITRTVVQFVGSAQAQQSGPEEDLASRLIEAVCEASSKPA